MPLPSKAQQMAGWRIQGSTLYTAATVSSPVRTCLLTNLRRIQCSQQSLPQTPNQRPQSHTTVNEVHVCHPPGCTAVMSTRASGQNVHTNIYKSLYVLNLHTVMIISNPDKSCCCCNRTGSLQRLTRRPVLDKPTHSTACGEGVAQTTALPVMPAL